MSSVATLAACSLEEEPISSKLAKAGALLEMVERHQKSRRGNITLLKQYLSEKDENRSLRVAVTETLHCIGEESAYEEIADLLISMLSPRVST